LNHRRIKIKEMRVYLCGEEKDKKRQNIHLRILQQMKVDQYKIKKHQVMQNCNNIEGIFVMERPGTKEPKPKKAKLEWCLLKKRLSYQS
jgi:hypothetical protein